MTCHVQKRADGYYVLVHFHGDRHAIPVFGPYVGRKAAQDQADTLCAKRDHIQQERKHR